MIIQEFYRRKNRAEGLLPNKASQGSGKAGGGGVPSASNQPTRQDTPHHPGFHGTMMDAWWQQVRGEVQGRRQ